MRRVLLAGWVLASSIVPGEAKMPVDTLVKATKLIQENKPKEAYLLLKSVFDPKDTNADELFIMGLASKQAGFVQESVGHFETTLARAPDAHRVRLELAAAFMEAGEPEKAKPLLLTVQNSNPPAAVAQNIDRFMEVINAATPRSWRVWGSTGMVYDTNANAGPSVDTVTLFGLPFTLSDAAKSRPDAALIVNLGLDHVGPISEDLAWLTAVSIKGTDYFKLNSLDNVYGYASTGPVWRQSPAVIWSLPVFVDGSTFRNGNDWYALGYGINPQVRYALNPLWEIILGGTVAIRDYQSESRDNVLAWAVTPGMGYRLGPATIIRGGVSYGQEETDQHIYANGSWSVNLGLTHSFSELLTTSVSGRLSDVKYHEKELAFANTRHDQIWQVGAEVSYRLQPIDWDLVLSASHTGAGSNLDMYSYDRSQFSAALRKVY